MPAPPSAPPTLDSPVTAVPGVGPDRAALLARLGINTVRDLLLTPPRRYEDRRHFVPIRDLQQGKAAAASGRIIAAGVNRFKRSMKSVYEFVLDDGTARLHCRWWNLPFMERLFAIGDEVMVYGKCLSVRPRTIDHPETEKVEAGDDATLHIRRVVPIYPLTEGLTQRVMRTLAWRAVERFGPLFTEPAPALVPLRESEESDGKEAPVTELQIASAAASIRWPSRAAAVRALHFPPNLPDADLARKRLALDEFIALQLEIQQRRQRMESRARPLPCAGDNRLMRPFLSSLGFRLTDAQTRVLREIRSDLGGTTPMRRLLQGDVGAGKTVVAACAALMTLESGFTVALMAPTEILAEQLHRNFARWFEPLGLRVGLRTGNLRKGLADDTEGHSPHVTVGTHALIDSAAQFERLGLVIIDEQHKFGVAQREALVRKGTYPHLLVMTATPIPRTLGLTLYGDLDVSVLDQLPAGRGRIRTHVRTSEVLPKVWVFVRQQLEAGRQAYIVYPRVIESDHDDVKAATREFERLRKELAPHSVGLLHGQLPPSEKDSVMREFRSGNIQALLSTSVIEVGVDVPNATVMVIENAEQFGLAQLHQLRGRIGRGGNESHCILVSQAVTEESQERLKVLAGTTDGFEIAEADLRLRGPGELTGRQQSGVPALVFGDLRFDRPLVELARGLVHRHLRPPSAPH